MAEPGAILSSIRNMVNIDPQAEYQAVGTLKIPVLLIWGKRGSNDLITGDR
jgi:hypothetical protein